MTLSARQVLRTKVPLKADGKAIPPRTRVVVMSFPDGKVKAKVVDSARPALAGLRFTTTPGAFLTTSRGRPVGSTAEVMAARRAEAGE